MALLEQWQALWEEKQKKGEANRYWKTYIAAETDIYRQILTSKPHKNTVEGYAKKYGVDLLTMAAFLDGINNRPAYPGPAHVR